MINQIKFSIVKHLNAHHSTWNFIKTADHQCSVYIFNPFQVTDLFLHPLKTSNSGSLMFSGGRERNQWHKMGWWQLEAATRGVLWKKVFFKVSQNSQENTCARVSFLIKLQALTQVFSCEFCEIFLSLSGLW